MGRVSGIIKDKNGNGLAGVTISLKDEKFEDIYTTLTNQNGEFELEAENGNYPFLVAVKDYGENFLEYWCQNIMVDDNELQINASIDKLEIYGLHCFMIKGAYPAFTLYFRPMSLARHLKGEADITPPINNDSIKATINGLETSILSFNEVNEYAGETNMKGYLIQVSIPEKWEPEKCNFLDIQITDLDGNFGQASVFF